MMIAVIKQKNELGIAMNSSLSQITLENALTRSYQALERIDALSKAAAVAPAATTSPEDAQRWEQQLSELEADNDALRDEITTLREENVNLSNQLQDIQQDYLDLQQVTEAVQDRLGQSVEQLDMLVAGQEAEAVA